MVKRCRLRWATGRERGSLLPASFMLAAALLPIAGPAAAQPPPERGVAVAEEQIRLLEQALEQAVRRGVNAVEQRLPAPVPGLIFFAGTIQARGFVVDGYGLFFDVEFPVVRRSILWSIGAIEHFDGGMAQSLANLRRRVLEMPAGPARSALEQALRDLERLTRPPAAVPETAADADPPAGDRGDGPLPSAAADPEAFYHAALQGALADALVAYGGALPPGALADGDWLTVAARDGRGRRAGALRTLQLRIRGGDLSALRDGRLSADDTRDRIEVR